jgi:phasin family protein
LQQKNIDDSLLTYYTSFKSKCCIAAQSEKIGIFIMFTQLNEQLTEQFTTAMKSFKNADQFSTAMKPFNNLVEINSKTVEQLINQQAALITTIMNDSVAQTKALSEEKDIAAAIESQKVFTEALQEKVTAAAKEAQDVVTKTSEEVTSLVKDSIAEASAK